VSYLFAKRITLMKHVLFSVAAGLVGLASATSTYAATTLWTETFEGGNISITNSCCSTYSSGSSFTGVRTWDVLSGTVDIVKATYGGGFPTSGGTGNSLDLNGNGPGTISHTSYLGAGSYSVKFDYSANPYAAPSDPLGLKFGVSQINGSGTILLASAALPAALSMTSTNYAFNVATAGNYSLTFAGLNSGFSGVVIDNVSMSITSPVPEPGDFAMMLSGLAVVGLIVRRRGNNS
jgi:hypothetical protein